MRILHRILLVLTTLFWLVMFCGTHMPAPRLPDLGANTDKMAHFGGFFVFACLLVMTIRTRPSRRMDRDWLVLLLMLVYAAFDERTQPYFGRTCDVMDWMADACGGAAGVATMGSLRYLLRLGRRIRRQWVAPRPVVGPAPVDSNLPESH